jgi:hypothetical protein
MLGGSARTDAPAQASTACQSGGTTRHACTCNKGREGPDDRNEARQDDRLPAMFLVVLLCLLNVRLAAHAWSQQRGCSSASQAALQLLQSSVMMDHAQSVTLRPAGRIIRHLPAGRIVRHLGVTELMHVRTFLMTPRWMARAPVRARTQQPHFGAHHSACRARACRHRHRHADQACS